MANKAEEKPWSDSYGDEDDYYQTKGSGCMIPILLAMLIGLGSCMMSCTDNSRARTFGGTETINLPPGQRLINATWKETQIWYLTEPMPVGYRPQQKLFQEKSSHGFWEGKVIFIERESGND